MATYNLSSSQADRINYDNANGMYFDSQIDAFVQAGGNLIDLLNDRSIFETWFDLDQEDVDDREEAESRAWSIFEKRVNYAQMKAAA